MLLARLRSWTAAALLGAVLFPFAAPVACLMAERMDMGMEMEMDCGGSLDGTTITAAAEAGPCHVLACGVPRIAPLLSHPVLAAVSPLMTHDRPSTDGLVSRVLAPPTPPPQA